MSDEKKGSSARKVAKSVQLLENDGIHDSQQCIDVLFAIAQDVGREAITPQVGNTMCNAIGKGVRVKELEMKYGTANQLGQRRLALAT